MNIGENIHKPVIDINHAELKRVDESLYRSFCPECKEGVLLVSRCLKTFALEEYDRCITCGQRFRYLDIKNLRAREKGEIK
ncbi:MAG: hypothetical protein Q7R33_02805 [Nitrosarchaeum sp.]|nr:hypothetical protein [Nitrosarchaeum sp.]